MHRPAYSTFVVPRSRIDPTMFLQTEVSSFPSSTKTKPEQLCEDVSPAEGLDPDALLDVRPESRTVDPF